MKIYIKLLYSCLFNSTIRGQLLDIKKIPIIIISFNQYNYLKQNINIFLKLGFKKIVVIDNASSYPPLLDYFEEIKSKVKIHRLKKNYGHLVFWRRKDIFSLYSKGFYIVTDPDVIPLNPQYNFVKKALMKLLKYPGYTKVGLSLNIDDIPLTYKFRQEVLAWESQFWVKDRDKMCFIANIDTTMALYKPNYMYHVNTFYKGLRLKKPYIAKHGGWYIDYNNLTGEEQFYLNTVNESSSWAANSKGKLTYDKYKNIVN